MKNQVTKVHLTYLVTVARSIRLDAFQARVLFICLLLKTEI